MGSKRKRQQEAGQTVHKNNVNIRLNIRLNTCKLPWHLFLSVHLRWSWNSKILIFFCSIWKQRQRVSTNFFPNRNARETENPDLDVRSGRNECVWDFADPKLRLSPALIWHAVVERGNSSFARVSLFERGLIASHSPAWLRWSASNRVQNVFSQKI